MFVVHHESGRPTVFAASRRSDSRTATGAEFDPSSTRGHLRAAPHVHRQRGTQRCHPQSATHRPVAPNDTRRVAAVAGQMTVEGMTWLLPIRGGKSRFPHDFRREFAWQLAQYLSLISIAIVSNSKSVF